MLIVITLGARYAEWQEPTIIRTLGMKQDAEFDPDDFFDTLQRIGHPTDPDANHTQCDIDRIKAKYTGTWRSTLEFAYRAMHRRGGPSMSVGDTIDVYSNPDAAGVRTPIVRHTCESVGWTSGPIPGEQAA